MKKKYVIALVCFIAVVLFAALYVFVIKDSEKSTPNRVNMANLSTPAPTVVPTPTPTPGPIIPFKIQRFGLSTDQFIYGVATNKININKPENFFVTEYINTTLVEGKKIICWYGYSENNFSMSKDATKIVFKSNATEETNNTYETLFFYDSEKDVVQNISSAVVAGYDYNYYKSISFGDGFGVKWIDNLKLSEDNLLVAYESNRRLYEGYVNEVLQAPDEIRYSDDENHIPYPKSDIWLKDLTSGEEYLLIEEAYVYGWTGRTLIYQEYGASNFSSLNIDTKEVKTMQTAEDFGKYISNYLIDTSGYDVKTYNVITGLSESYSVTEEGLTIHNHEIIQADDGKLYFVITFRDTVKTNDSYGYYLSILDIESGNKKLYKVPDNNVGISENSEILGIVGDNKIILSNNRVGDSEYIDCYLVELEEYTR